MDHLGKINTENVLIVKNLKSLQILQLLLRTSSLVTVKLPSGFCLKMRCTERMLLITLKINIMPVHVYAYCYLDVEG